MPRTSPLRKQNIEKMRKTRKEVVNFLKKYREFAGKLKDIMPLDEDWADALIVLMLDNGWKMK